MLLVLIISLHVVGGVEYWNERGAPLADELRDCHWNRTEPHIGWNVSAGVIWELDSYVRVEVTVVALAREEL